MSSLTRLPSCSSKPSYLSLTKTHHPTLPVGGSTTTKQTRQRIVTTKTKQSQEKTMNTKRIPGIMPKRVQRQSNKRRQIKRMMVATTKPIPITRCRVMTKSNKASQHTHRPYRPFLHPERTMNNKKAPLLKIMILTKARQSSSQTGGNGDNKPNKNLRTSWKCGPKQIKTKQLKLIVMDDATCATSPSQRPT